MISITKTSNFPNRITQILKSIESSGAKSFHVEAMDRLEEAGFEAQWEYPVSDRGDGRKGRVDIVVKGKKGMIGIELDRRSPRKKSLFKLKNNFTRWAIVCRY